MTQFTRGSPRPAGPPCVATTLPPFTATITPQPVPQKRHGALDQRSWADSLVLGGRRQAHAGGGSGHRAADSRMKSRRVRGEGSWVRSSSAAASGSWCSETSRADTTPSRRWSSVRESTMPASRSDSRVTTSLPVLQHGPSRRTGRQCAWPGPPRGAAWPGPRCRQRGSAGWFLSSGLRPILETTRASGRFIAHRGLAPAWSARAGQAFAKLNGRVECRPRLR